MIGSELDLLAGLAPLLELRDGGEQRIGRGVDGGLDGVLNDADDEADADDLHGDVIGDAEQGAGHGDEQQRAARNAGRAARGSRMLRADLAAVRECFRRHKPRRYPPRSAPAGSVHFEPLEEDSQNTADTLNLSCFLRIFTLR